MSDVDRTGDDFSEDYESAERVCYECDGRGWKVTCPDDMCHGRDECIHGDPPTPCRNCNPGGHDTEGFCV